MYYYREQNMLYMSNRNAYRIYVDLNDDQYKQLREDVDNLFKGHVRETEYGLFAEDSPGVSSAFSEKDPRYVSKSDIKRELSRYSEIIDKIEHIYANDTNGKRTEKELEI